MESGMTEIQTPSDFARACLAQIGNALGLTYEQMTSDYAAAETAADIAWAREKEQAYAIYNARVAAMKRGLQQCIFGPHWSEMMFDVIGLPRGMRP
jgi:hypothetical protein